MANTQEMQLLESKIKAIVENILTEKKKKKKKKKVDTVDKNKSYKRLYKAIEKSLDEPQVNATQILSKALGFDASDDSERSKAFKKLHKKPTPDKSSNYEFDSKEVVKIAAELS